MTDQSTSQAAQDQGSSQGPAQRGRGDHPALATALITLIEHFERVDAPSRDRDAIQAATNAYAAYQHNALWRSIESAPRDGTEVLIWNSEGYELATWHEREEDGVDQPGHDAGWVGTFAFPGRSWGQWMRYEPQGQPNHWMPLPEPPEYEEIGAAQ